VGVGLLLVIDAIGGLVRQKLHEPPVYLVDAGAGIAAGAEEEALVHLLITCVDAPVVAVEHQEHMLTMGRAKSRGNV